MNTMQALIESYSKMNTIVIEEKQPERFKTKAEAMQFLMRNPDAVVSWNSVSAHMQNGKVRIFPTDYLINLDRPQYKG